MSNGNFTLSEIESQPTIWKSILNDYFHVKLVLPPELKDVKDKYFLVTGCGSTHYLSISVATIIRKLGFPSHSITSFRTGLFLGGTPTGRTNFIDDFPFWYNHGNPLGC